MHIKKLKIFSPNIKAQSKFYTQILGLTAIEQVEKTVSYQIGASILHIEERADAAPYHFAINIPANKAHEALAWLLPKVTILKDGKNEIQDFDFWNAEAVYFYDADKNIVEFIARKNLPNAADEPFDTAQFLEISEIGLPTADIKSIYDRLHQLAGLQIFSGGFERFLAIGDEYGLFICIDKNKKDWFPTGDKAHASDFEIEFEEKGTAYVIVCEKEKLANRFGKSIL